MTKCIVTLTHFRGKLGTDILQLAKKMTNVSRDVYCIPLSFSQTVTFPVFSCKFSGDSRGYRILSIKKESSGEREVAAVFLITLKLQSRSEVHSAHVSNAGIRQHVLQQDDLDIYRGNGESLSGLPRVGLSYTPHKGSGDFFFHLLKSNQDAKLIWIIQPHLYTDWLLSKLFRVPVYILETRLMLIHHAPPPTPTT